MVTLEIQALTSDVESALSGLDLAAGDDAALMELNRRLVELSDQLVDKGVELSQRVSDIRTQIDQLGAIAPDGTDLFSEERAALVDERTRLNLLIGQLEKASVRARTGVDDVSEARRDAFAQSLSRRYDLSTAFGSQLFEVLGSQWQNLTRRVGAWATFTWRTKQQTVLGSVFVASLICLVVLLGARRLGGHLVHRDNEIATPSYFDRLTTGFFYAVLPFLITLTLLIVVFAVFQNSGILRNDISAMLGTLFGAVLVVLLVWRLAEALFSPSKPLWRIVPVADHAAFPLKALTIAMALVSVTDLVITQINDIIGHELTITIAKSLVTGVLTGALLAAIAYVRPYARVDEDGLLHATGGRWPRWIRWLLLALGSVLIVSALLGFIGFARFAAQQTVISGATIITGLLGLQAARAIAAEGALQDRRIARFLRAQFGFGETGIDQAGLAMGVTLGAVVVLTILPSLAYFWGFDLTTIGRWFRWFFTGITIGSITISLTGIAAGIALFAFGFWVTKRVQNLIDKNVLERGRVEIGARTSIRTAIGYVGVAIAGLIGVSAAGIDLTQLAFIAGALSLGIGFGLQNIVNNFVSGLILLAERPFKTGDIIDAGGYTGVVKNVNVRATEVELFDQKTVILPNSELINSSVSNWMHRNTLARMEVPIGVAYGSDPQLVIDTLVDIANDHPRVLSNPEPFVAFVDFGASSLDFTLYAYIADVSFGLGTRTELRLEIVKRFDVLGIEIPFPQRDVNLRVMRDHDKQKPRVEQGTPEFDVIDTSKTRTSDDDD